MRRFILGILFVVMVSDPTQATPYYQREYRDEYTSEKVFIRVLAGLTQVPDDISDDAREVNLRYNMLTDIPVNAFSNLGDCRILRLTWNKISVIEPGSFNGLNSLTELSLSDNMISAIPEGTFTSLSSLIRIDLTRNNIQTIRANVFPNTLEQLLLSYNNISALEYIDFTNLVFLTQLVLHNNKISTLPANTFSTLSNCATLFLSNNPIENIEAGAFHGLDKITSINLYVTSLTHLSQNIFQGLPSLKHLKVFRSRILEIARGTFTGLDQLLTLGLNQNELTVIESYTFSGLVSLKELYLLENNITDIKDLAFLPLGNLTSLYLNENQLEHLRPSTFTGLGSLEFLDLGENKLTTLDPLVLSPLRRPLDLTLDSQPSSMVCDMKLCWLKMEEEAGNIVWNYLKPTYHSARATGVLYPTCTGGVDWRFLQCPATLPCRDPGDVDFAERSGSFLPLNNNSQPGLDLPYSTDSELRYTCGPCYTGGGTITCQSNGQWTSKPECVRLDNNVVCRAPVLVDGYLTPSFDQYDCGVKVTFTCNQGSTQTVGVCGPDGQFIGGISSCEQNGNGVETATDSPGQGTNPESEGSSGLIYGIVGAVGGLIILLALIGLTIFCIKRSKKEKPSYADTARTQDTVTDGGYIGIVTDGNNGATEGGYLEPTPCRGVPGQRVAGDSTVFRNTAYEHEYLEIEDVLPNNGPSACVDEDVYAN